MRDYVTIILTDRVDLDVIDLQERLHAAFRICWKFVERIADGQL